MNILFIKVTLMPLVIGVVTLASRKWGNKVGGLIASLPWVVGPILLFFILEQGKDFGIRAVPGILTGIVSLIGFCYCYVQISTRLSWLPTLLISYVVYVLVGFLFDFVKLDLVLMYALAMGSIGLALRYFPVPVVQAIPTQARRYRSICSSGWWLLRFL